MSIDDYYKTLGYACFYKADTGNENTVEHNQITISFVCTRRPRKLLHHLLPDRNLTIREVSNGIYYLEGEIFPIQLLLTRHLSSAENLWLRSLSDNLSVSEIKDLLIPDYLQHENNLLYHSALDIMIRANEDRFEETKNMCDALLELFKNEFEEERAEGQKLKLVDLICRKLKKQKSPEVISEELEEDLSLIQTICEIASQFAPEYDCNKILEAWNS